MEQPSSSDLAPQQSKQVKITEVEVTDENVALNLMVAFLEIAHKKGAFTFEESAKIWECIRKFQASTKK
jgi:hypothetical protein